MIRVVRVTSQFDLRDSLKRLKAVRNKRKYCDIILLIVSHPMIDMKNKARFYDLFPLRKKNVKKQIVLFFFCRTKMNEGRTIIQYRFD